jgi:mannose-6-phosphate isomerase
VRLVFERSDCEPTLNVCPNPIQNGNKHFYPFPYFYILNMYPMQTMTQTAAWIQSLGLTIVDQEFSRPWGGFLVIAEEDSQAFADHFFPGIEGIPIGQGVRLSPKILMVNPGQRLSWQYHYRRREMWTVVEGPVAVATSPTDEELPAKDYFKGDLITLQCGERHRLIGKETMGIVAEFWIHTDFNHLSDEADIVRVQDDYARQ